MNFGLSGFIETIFFFLFLFLPAYFIYSCIFFCLGFGGWHIIRMRRMRITSYTSLFTLSCSF
jgi:hypothetical protein